MSFLLTVWIWSVAIAINCNKEGMCSLLSEGFLHLYISSVRLTEHMALLWTEFRLTEIIPLRYQGEEVCDFSFVSRNNSKSLIQTAASTSVAGSIGLDLTGFSICARGRSNPFWSQKDSAEDCRTHAEWKPCEMGMHRGGELSTVILPPFCASGRAGRIQLMSFLSNLTL